jgi:hypothetical protein
MIELLIFCLDVSGATQIITFGKIFEGLRGRFQFFKCPLCVGFWVGVYFAMLSRFTELFSYSGSLFEIFLMGCIGSLISYVTYAIFGDDGININTRRENNE